MTIRANSGQSSHRFFAAAEFSEDFGGNLALHGLLHCGDIPAEKGINAFFFADRRRDSGLISITEFLGGDRPGLQVRIIGFDLLGKFEVD
jgi:hypothetical protein